MFKAFSYSLSHDCGVNRKDKLILAVSGGLDSIVLCHLCREADLDFIIAHCHFGLRKEEADRDLDFVSDLASRLKVKFYSKRFQTKEFAKKNTLSVQMAARELRYTWFEELRKELMFDYILTAHHLDDEIETFFINLLRGSGISGFHGILPRHGRLIRPLLNFSRVEIEDYATKNKLLYCIDSSNQEDNYLRNRIRHDIIPPLKSIQAGFEKTMAGTFQRIREEENILLQKIEEENRKIIQAGHGEITLNIQLLKNLHPLGTFLFHFLRPYNFNISTIEGLLKSIDNKETRHFYSPDHHLVKDRENIRILPYLGKAANSDITGTSVYLIEEEIKPKGWEMDLPMKLHFTKKKRTSAFCLIGDEQVAQFDYDRLEWPLILRKWKTGDYFYPLGMRYKKKLSDFFIDKKYASDKKDSTWLLCSGKNIIWVVGKRIDERYKVDDHTKSVLTIEWIQ